MSVYQKAGTVPAVSLLHQAPAAELQVAGTGKPTPLAQQLQPKHIPTLDALRGIAVLSVCWFHFTNAQFVERFGAYRETGKYGYLGVQIFFVISGFIIPFSLFRGNYQIRSYGRFILKRVTRLDPPYIISVLLVVLGYWLSSLSPGHPPYSVPWGQVLSHFGYMNAFLGTPWLQMSYWSLAIEFQYYVLIGACFPLLTVKTRTGQTLMIASFVVLSILGDGSRGLLPHYLPLFGLGVLVFRRRSLGIGSYETLLGMAFMTMLAMRVDGYLEALVAAACCVAIMFVRVDHGVLTFFGKISYSLYLTHVFIGNAVFGLGSKWLQNVQAARLFLPFIALSIAIAAACLLYKLVELPSQRLASRISYR